MLMIAAGPNGSKALFMANIWSSTTSNLSSASRAFQHKPLKSTSEESLNLDLLTMDAKNVKKKKGHFQKRYKSQNDADDWSEHEFVMNDDLNNWLHDDADHDLEKEDGELSETCQSRGNSPTKANKRNGELKKNDKIKHEKDLLTSILDDTDDLDQIDYFDDDEICAKPIEQVSAVQQNTSGDESPKSNESLASELLRMLSIKSANIWWRRSNNDSEKTMKIYSTKQAGNENANGNIDQVEIEMNPIEPTSGNSSDLLSSRTEAAITKLKNLAKLYEEKMTMDKFTEYKDEPNEQSERRTIVFINGGCSEIYRVKDSQETLSSIAAMSNTTPAEIKLLNRLPHDYIFAGQLLLIPLMVETKLTSEKSSNSK